MAKSKTTLLVIDGERQNTLHVLSGTQKDSDYKCNWAKLFEESKENVEVIQCGWDDIIHVSCDPFRSEKPNPSVEISLSTLPAREAKKRFNKPSIRVVPNFILVRNEVRIPAKDCRNMLLGLMYSGVPSVNSLTSIYLSCDRPVVHAELVRIKREVDRECTSGLGSQTPECQHFPLIDQVYFSCEHGMMYGYQFPAVAKVGFAHAGAGKMVVKDHVMMEDFQSVLKMTNGQYCTVEPFIDGDEKFDLRIQKIGNDVRVFTRVSISGNWKTNVGSALFGELFLPECSASGNDASNDVYCHYGNTVDEFLTEVLPKVTAKNFHRYCDWIKLASRMFGGLDICTMDVVCCKDVNGVRKEYILEVNDTSSGLAPFCEEEDNRKIRDLVLGKMKTLKLI
ncbi:synapsin-like [Convolutriloba macropyga]|uniref:synapsin-like n=1 Tax=Convolutriloba macropyga TaxID=536237 RepID=UPI003F526BD0